MTPPGKGNKAIITGSVAIVFAVVFIWWMLTNHQPLEIVERVPGMDERPKVQPRSDSVIIGEFFDTLNIFDEIVPGEWPRFRGNEFDNICKDSVPLAEKWDSSGPPVVWKATLGEGYAGAAVRNGRVYVLDYNERRKTDVLRCFSLKSGIEIWRRWYYVELKRNHGYSRTIPAVTDKYLVSIGPRSHVMCVDPINGDLLWTLDLEKEYSIPGKEKGRITPDFYTGQCPIIDNDVAILAPGGKALMIGVSCATGKVIWKTPNPDTLRMSHCSIIPMTINGKKMYVYNAVGGVVGVSAEGEDLGKLLWTTLEWSPATVAASPILLADNEIALFGSYGAGGAKVAISYNGSDYSVKLIEQHKATEGIASDQQTPIKIDNFIWTLMPENAGALKKQLVCYNISDLRKPVWSSGKESRYGRGLGPYIVRGDKMFLLDDDGKLYFFKLEKSSATLIASYNVLKGIEAWGPLALAGNYLIMRDSKNLICLFIGKNNQI
jgi:outer membrane protein assembly factor BamB